MKANQILKGAAALLLTLGAEALNAAPVVDVIQANTGYFVPDDSLKYNAPYYRWWDEDWGWTHNGISGTSFTSASLSISAFDVDRSSGEVDVILRGFNGGGVTIGSLAGGNDIWSYTTFNLNVNDPAVVAAINGGFQVFIDIDSTHNYDVWAVCLAKSVLEVDGGTLPPPEPGVPDGGATLVLLGVSALAIGGLKKRLN